MLSKEELVETLIRVDHITGELNGADRVICMSRVLREACEAVGIAPEKLVVLGNRVSTKRFQPLPQLNYDRSMIRAVFIGRLEQQKNIDGIAQALAQLRGQGWKVSLDVCGGRSVNHYLRQAISCLQPSEWRYRGSVPNRELPGLYQTVDMYVGPSFFEGFQIPLIEALACGKPCVASDQPPANEIISADVGALVDSSRSDSIAGGILSVKRKLNDPQQAPVLRAACRALALQKWSYQAISKQEADLYWEVLSSLRRK